ncbi:MAG: nucleotidyl transferase AbiEii/AbiGii toxin family protein [Candidatus Aminicenantes bacterium]|nr:nucleotidyl transferase AbiEii/AbiGii toxin family protein [Candidatus Aminicenantes bacterium]
MLDLIEKSIVGISGREAKIHTTREFLQLLILKILYDKGYFKNLAFVGGTALRFLYGLRRFSEDLDFSLINRKGYDLDIFLERVAYELEKAGFSLEIKKSAEGSVHSAMFKFKDVLSLLGLSNQKGQKLFIKFEVDSNPPRGWRTELSLVSKHFVFTVTHFDIPSLYATKLHACFFRKYIKGRDFYDLIWYLGRKAIPNFELLNNAIEQTEHKKINLNADNFNDFLKERLAGVDFVKVRKDVERFIEDKNELKLLDKDLILKLIG